MTPKAKGDKKNRVQGTTSDLVDLVLHNGKKLALEIGGGIIPTPTLTRTIEGSSSITIGIYDPDLSFLRASLLAEQWDAKIDDLWFRYVSTSKTGLNLALTLEDRDVAKLRNFKGPKKVLRAHSTRAEFIKSLVEEAAPDLDFICPQLHVKQPIENKEKAKKAKEESKANLGKGLGDTKGLKVKGTAATKAQIELGHTALQIAEHANAPFIVQVALIAALIDESDMGAAAAGNVLQALGSGGAPKGSAEEEISGFLTGKPKWTSTSAIQYHKENPGKTFYEIAQAVQASGAGQASNGAANYGQFGDEAREWVESYGGGSEGELASRTVTEPYRFEVGKKETYWAAIQRLAKQVNWRAFISAGRFYFMPEPELLQGMVRLTIDPELVNDPSSGIEDVDFDFHLNKAITEAKVTALASQWTPPPGSVVTIAGYGPASLGFGDAPIEKNAKGQKAGLSSNMNTRTGEGRARYLVSSIESPLTESSDARLVTITLKKATAPLKEPAAATKTLSASASASGGSSTGYVNPFPSGWTRSRTDQGVDFGYTTAGAKIDAIGNAKILATGAAGWPGGGGVLYELLDGSHQGDIIFVYEGIIEHVHAGQKVNAGDLIGTGGITGSIEIGFADASGVPLSHAEYTEGKETKSGKEMGKFLDSLGAP